MRLNFRYLPLALWGVSLWAGLLLFTGTVQASVKPVELEYDHGFVTLRPGRFSLLEVLERLAQEARLDIYITEAFSNGPRGAGFTKLPVYEALCTLLKGYSFAVVYSHGPDQGGQVFLSGGGSFLNPAEALSFQAAAVSAKASPASRVSPEPGASASSPALSGSTRASASTRISASVAASPAGAGSPSAGSSSRASTADAGETDPDEGTGTDEKTGESSLAQKTVASQQGSLQAKSSLEYKIQKLEQEIESGRADQWYNFWVTKKDPRYITNPRDELARYQQELKKLKSN